MTLGRQEPNNSGCAYQPPAALHRRCWKFVSDGFVRRSSSAGAATSSERNRCQLCRAIFSSAVHICAKNRLGTYGRHQGRQSKAQEAAGGQSTKRGAGRTGCPRTPLETRQRPVFDHLEEAARGAPWPRALGIEREIKSAGPSLELCRWVYHQSWLGTDHYEYWDLGNAPKAPLPLKSC